MQDNASRKKTGYIGEDIAAQFLEKNGCCVICRNYTVRGGEIDIIASDGETLIFVEVKTRKNEIFGRASEAVDGKKISHMCTAASRFLYENRENAQIASLAVRFDVIEVYTQNRRVRHIKNIDIN